MHLRHAGFKGFKLYSPYTACSEVCTRVPGCVSWAYPPTSENSTPGCELFYTNEDDPKSSVGVRLLSLNSIDEEDEGRRRLEKVWGVEPGFGTPRSEETAYFLGCGWSFWLADEYPCENPTTDDLIANFTFFFSGDGHDEEDAMESLQRPLCTAPDESLEKSRGRWVRRPYPNSTECPDETMIKGVKFEVETYVFDPDRPICWNRENLSLLGNTCVERGCDQWRHGASTTWLHDETHFFGTWEPYSCRYKEFTNSELQRCIVKKNISSITTSGSSISTILSDYLAVRTAGLSYVNETDLTVKVDISTNSFPHLLWHNTMEEIATTLKKLPKSTSSMQKYWVTSLYITGEREEFVHNGRSRMFTEIAEPILKEKGWTELNMYDMGAAFMYDTTGQMDGLHVIGPPMKMVMTKFFSHLCTDVDLES
jgi:hypothetical protein